MINKTTADLFFHHFNHVDAIAVTFNPEWRNGTGYYDHLVYDDVLPDQPFGAIGTSFDPDSRRKILFLKTRHGNAVIFERFTDGESGVFVRNIPNEVGQLLCLSSGAVQPDDMERLFASSAYYENFAQKFERALSDIQQGCAWMTSFEKRLFRKAVKEQPVKKEAEITAGVLSVGDTTFCQFGYADEVDHFRADVPVEIVQIDVGPATQQVNFFIRSIEDPSLYGRAKDVIGSAIEATNKGRLHCIKSGRVGDLIPGGNGATWTFESLKKALYFR